MLGRNGSEIIRVFALITIGCLMSLVPKPRVSFTLSIAVISGVFGGGHAGLAQPDPAAISSLTGGHTASTVSSAQFTFAPLSPSCPFPPIPLSESTDEIISFSLFVKPATSEPEQVQSSLLGESSENQWPLEAAGISPEIVRLIRAGQLEAALALVPKIQNPYEREATLASISEAYLQRGQLQQAETIALGIPAPSLPEGELHDVEPYDGEYPFGRDWAISSVITAYINAGQLDSALALVNQRDEEDRLPFLLDIAEHYQVQGQPAKALAVLDLALANYRSEEEEKTEELAKYSLEAANAIRFTTLARFMGIYSVAGGARQAAALANELVTLVQSFTRQTLLTLYILLGTAYVYEAVNQKEQANSVLTFVLQSTEALEESYVKAMILSGVARVYTALEENDRAQQVLYQAQELADAVSEASQQSVSTVSLIPTYLALGQPENALRITEAIEPLELRQQVQQAITCAQANPSR